MVKTNTKKTNTNKTIKPEFIVNLMGVKDSFDVAVNFALAKQSAGKAISDSELETIIASRVSDLAETFALYFNAATIAMCDVCEEKKPRPWYKRFWNWLRGRKN